MKVKRFINSIFTSNSYILYTDDEKEVWGIDPGDSNQITDWLQIHDKKLKGIFITHAHFDHIYGINDLQKIFPEIPCYASLYAREGMISEKLNGSVYHEMPYVVKRKDIKIIKEGDSIKLWKNITLNVFETPGHNRDCLSFQIGKNLFTGDALIPGIKVFTKFKGANKAQAIMSVNRIFEEFADDIRIWPGHERNCLLGDLKLETVHNQELNMYNRYSINNKLITEK